MNDEEQTPTDDRPGAEQGLPDRDTPGREAEDVSRSGSEQVPRSEADDVPRTEEELRGRIEEQLRNLRVQDLMVESVVSVLNLTARRIAKEDERDFEQARLGIEAVRAWVELLPEEPATQIRNALSELQLLYAQAAEGGPGEKEQEPGAEQGGPPRGAPASEAEDEPRRGGEPPPRLWTPPGSS